MTIIVMTEPMGLDNSHDVMRVMTINSHDKDTMGSGEAVRGDGPPADLSLGLTGTGA